MNNKNDLVSFCLFTYNQENFIQEAIEGALSQTYSNLEIIISDDCSSDGTQDIIKRIVKDYKGPHKINTNFNEKNLGLVRHVNKVLYEICLGEFIFLAAGDDISLKGRVEDTITFYKKNPDVVATGCDILEVDHFSERQNTQQFKRSDEDALYDLSYYISPAYQHVSGCTRTFRRELINAFPPLDQSCPTEDTPLLLRAYLLNKNVAHLKEAMVMYRIHGNNISSPENIVLMSVPAIFAQYKKDLKLALKQNYISHSQYNSLKKILKIRKLQRMNKITIDLKMKMIIKKWLNLKLNFSKKDYFKL